METKVNFTHDKVKHDQDNEVHMVVTLKAPKKDWEEKRQAVCILPSIDISGSMHGAKMDYAKKSALKLVDHLKPGDYSGLVVFANCAQVVSKPVEMTQANKDLLKQKIGDLYATTSTDFSGGMLEGLRQLNDTDLPEDMMLRLIMLTDGHANVGVATKYPQLAKLLEQNMGRATISCFGYGEGADQELLADLAKKGKGNYAFIQNPDDALSAFALEVGGLLSTHAQNIEIEVVSKNGHVIDNVVSDVDADGDDKKVVIKLPEILSEEERHVVICTTLSEQTKALPRKLIAFDVNVKYDVVNEEGKLESVSDKLKAKISFVKPGKEQKKPDKKLDEIVAMAQMVKTQIDAEEKAKRGDYQGALDATRVMSESFDRRGHKGYSGATRKLGGMMRNRVAFSESGGYRGGFKTAATRSFGVKGMSLDARADYVGLVGDECLTNSAMDATTTSFTEGDSGKGSGQFTIDEDKTSNVKITIDTDPLLPITPGIFSNPPAQTEITITTNPSKTEKKSSSISKKRSKRW